MENLTYKLPLFKVVEGLRITTDKLDSKNFYAFNPSFDKCDQKCENRMHSEKK